MNPLLFSLEFAAEKAALPAGFFHADFNVANFGSRELLSDLAANLIGNVLG